MMTQNQSFCVISDSPASGEVNEQQYLGRTYVLYKDADASRKLQRGTINILEVAFYLDNQKRVLKRKKYKELLVSLDLEGEDKKYLKIGAVFSEFDPQDLALVEPDTIFLLAKNSKKYQSVIEQLKNETNITQKRVRELIKLNRKPRNEKTDDANDNVSVWRRSKSGGRYCQIGAIHEEDEFTGVTIQRIVDTKGVLPQTVVRKAMSLVEAYELGELVWVKNSDELNNALEESLFDVEEINTPSSIEPPSSRDNCIDLDSLLPDNEELQQATSDSPVNNDVNNSDISESAVDYYSDASESVVVLHSAADSQLEAMVIAEYLSQLQTWSEVAAVMQNCSSNLKLASWKLLDSSQKARIHKLKHEFEISNTKKVF